MEPWVTGVGAITLFVPDLAAAQEFYGRAFGLPVFFEDPQSAVYRFGSTLVNLLDLAAAPELVAPVRPDPAPAGPRAVMTLHVEDVDAVCARLAEHRVELLNGPMDRPWGPRTASFADPAGHVWEIASE